jgi:peptidoglycan hydrolase-like protein with peptidoglycan-binding domain
VSERAARVASAPEVRFRRSLRASRARREMAARRRRRILRGRRGLILALSGLAIMTTGAFADEASPVAGSQTAQVQKALGIPADGVYGPQTRGAVRRFQRSHGLSVDGVAGPATLAMLGVSSSTGSATSSPAQSAGDAGAASPGSTDTSSELAKIAQCESGGNPAAVSSSGQYRGKYQFDRSTWQAVGGTGDPASAPESEQDRRAALLLQRQGPSAWPNCAAS